MFLFDRIYGQIKLHPLVMEALDCPGLMRLRNVRMANVPFLSFPGLASVSRFEHSVGVCHLAQVFAKSADLSEKDRVELMLAALYHDAATPPFAHAMEEVLHTHFGFDHEQKLKELITGKSGIPGGPRSQVFLGRSLKVQRICQSKTGLRLGLSHYRIANLAVGDRGDPLGDVICSPGIDLDNIDNVARVALAMGITECDPAFAEVLARSLIPRDGETAIAEPATPFLREWQHARATLYGMIYAAVEDFAQQTMLKQAVALLLLGETGPRLAPDDWSLTDDQLLYDRLLLYPPSAEIVKRMMLGETYTCLALLGIEGAQAVQNLPRILPAVEMMARDLLGGFLSGKYGRTLDASKSPVVCANFYTDKRERRITRQLVFFDRVQCVVPTPSVPRAFLGVFTPHHEGWNLASLAKFVEFVSANCLGAAVVKPVRIRQGKYPDVYL